MASARPRRRLRVTVFDAIATGSARFAAETGGAGAESGAAPAGAADIVITMLTGAVVPRLLARRHRAVARPRRNHRTFLVRPERDARARRALAELGIALVDAPVSGGVRGVSGTLAIMIGGEDEAAIARARPVLETMGAKLFRTGPLGSGHAMKALNNYVAAAAFAATSEALLVGKRFGLEPGVMVEVMNASSGRSFHTDVVFPDHVVGGRFATGFALGLMAKDVGIAADLAREIGVETPLCRLTNELWAGARDAFGATRTTPLTSTAARSAALLRKELLPPLRDQRLPCRS
jgi:3-hydroxyisobutyrate dehydrogenase